MPSGIKNTTGKHFEITYEQPWGGVASDKDPVDIAENQLVRQQGVVAVNGALCYFNLVADGSRFLWSPAVTNALPWLIFEFSIEIYACDQFGQLYGLVVLAGSSTFLPLLHLPGNHPTQAPDYPWTNVPAAAQVVNGQVYISNPGNSSIYVWNGANGTGQFTLASNYVGSSLFGVLDNYLLQLNTNSTGNGPQPNGISWSVPGEFSIWDPSVNRAAGYNVIAGIDDQITGFYSLASVGIAVTQKGLVELSPTGVGIQPFNFTILWTSEVGEGCIYPKTVTQYGQIGLLLSDTGVYNVSTTGGFSDVSGAAKQAILASFQNPNFVSTTFNNFPLVAGTVFLYFYNSAYPSPFYMLVGFKGSSVAGSSNTPLLYVWLLDLKTGIWQEQVYNVDVLNAAQNTGGVLNGGTILYVNAESYNVPLVPIAGMPLNNVLIPNAQTLIWIGVNYAGVYKSVCLTPYLYNKQTLDSATNTVGTINLLFRAEEIKLGYTRKPTIRRIVVKAYGTGTLVCSIIDIAGVVTSFGTIVLDGTTNANTYYSSTGFATVEAPQLNITSTNFKGVIIKAMLVGTFSDGDID